MSGRLRTSASFPCPGGPAPHRLPAVPGHTPSGAHSAVSTTGDAGPQAPTLFSLFWNVIFPAKPSLPTLPKTPTPPNIPQHSSALVFLLSTYHAYCECFLLVLFMVYDPY